MSLRTLVFVVVALVFVLCTPGQDLAHAMPLATRIPTKQVLIASANGREEISTGLALSSLTQVFEARAAANDEPYRMVETRITQTRDGQNGDRRISPGPLIGLICAIVTSSVALGIAFNIRRRIDRIAGPDPEKEED